jgi:hypothetical protein
MKAHKIFQFLFALSLVMGFVVGSGLSNSSTVQASEKEKKERKEKRWDKDRDWDDDKDRREWRERERGRVFRITNTRANASLFSSGTGQREVHPREIRGPFRPRLPR